MKIRNTMKEELESHPFEKLSRPAQRALTGIGIKTLEQLSELTETQFMLLHGIGKNALYTILSAMAERNISFTQEEPMFV